MEVILAAILLIFSHSVSAKYSEIYLQNYCDEETAIVQVNESNAYGFLVDSQNQHYSPGKTCKLRLEAETKEQRLTIRFLFIDVFDSKRGCEDYLHITGEAAGRTYCGRSKPAESIYSSSNYLNFTFHTIKNSPEGKSTGFRITYTLYHTDKCDDSEFRCWYQDRCIPEVLRCDTYDNCGDFSDERYCSVLSAIGTVILAACISIALLMVMILLCICVIKVLFGKKHRDRRSSSTSVPISTIEQPNQNAGVTCAGVAMPQAAPGTANPYNEPPPSYYYVHYTRTDEKGDIEEGNVSINPSSSSIPPSCATQRVGGVVNSNTVTANQPSTVSDGRHEAVNRAFMGEGEMSGGRSGGGSGGEQLN